MTKVKEGLFNTNPVTAVSNYLEDCYEKTTNRVRKLDVKSGTFQNIGFIPGLGLGVQIFKLFSFIEKKESWHDQKISFIERSITRSLWVDIAITVGIFALLFFVESLFTPQMAVFVTLLISITMSIALMQATLRILFLFAIHVEKKLAKQSIEFKE